MPFFGTQEWCEEYMDRLNKNPAYAEAARTWEGDFVFIIRADGPLDHDMYLWIDLWHGKARDGRVLQSPDEVQAAFTYEGPYSNYVRLVEGKLDPIQGLMTGKFKLKGDMAKVMRAVKAAQELVSTITLIDTQFY
ncbi:MAG: SCP2 sterol-binding domain-containing protein [Theionarchaea archaeon]|nr:SCP2 sterol-binding domain-containing protein [Theionarchaea archaeon]MBU7001146.1 SCP2 sterol-binding domain-containing protein [Theionarchaea archaeon]MBU7019925.1 SCP2 sterol-binding domain-containing protein [Theionarchaea archaeon]MBU7034017.1 SCP2 sterol-binding domain-containing protein [Theionarchaea archaeon]MBU7039552.1 SCP2 sterol-binding domain-containing protein [Theionarchaea archaeon]